MTSKQPMKPYQASPNERLLNGFNYYSTDTPDVLIEHPEENKERIFKLLAEGKLIMEKHSEEPDCIHDGDKHRDDGWVICDQCGDPLREVE